MAFRKHALTKKKKQVNGKRRFDIAEIETRTDKHSKDSRQKARGDELRFSSLVSIQSFGSPRPSQSFRDNRDDHWFPHDRGDRGDHDRLDRTTFHPSVRSKFQLIATIVQRELSWIHRTIAGLEIDEKIQSQICDRIPKFSCKSQNLRAAISLKRLAKFNMSPQYLRVKKPLKMANDRKNATVPVFNAMFERSNIAAKLRYN